MKLTKRQLRNIIREAYARTLNEEFEIPPTVSDRDIKVLNNIWRTAESGYKLIVRDQRGSLYTGIGNRQGLHGYASQLAREKWVRGEKSLFRKLKKLNVGDVIQEKDGRNVHTIGRWTQGLADLLAMAQSPADVVNVFGQIWG